MGWRKGVGFVLIITMFLSMLSVVSMPTAVRSEVAGATPITIVQLWNVTHRCYMAKFLGDQYVVVFTVHGDISLDGKYISSGSIGATTNAYVYDIVSGKLVKSFTSDTDGDTWDFETGVKVWDHNGFFSADGKRMVEDVRVAGGTSAVVVDTTTWSSIPIDWGFTDTDGSHFYACQLDEDGTYLAVGYIGVQSSNDTSKLLVYKYNASLGKYVKFFEHTEYGDYGRRLQMTLDGQYILVGGILYPYLDVFKRVGNTYIRVVHYELPDPDGIRALGISDPYDVGYIAIGTKNGWGIIAHYDSEEDEFKIIYKQKFAPDDSWIYNPFYERWIPTFTRVLALCSHRDSSREGYAMIYDIFTNTSIVLHFANAGTPQWSASAVSPSSKYLFIGNGLYKAIPADPYFGEARLRLSGKVLTPVPINYTIDRVEKTFTFAPRVTAPAKMLLTSLTLSISSVTLLPGSQEICLDPTLKNPSLWKFEYSEYLEGACSGSYKVLSTSAGSINVHVTSKLTAVTLFTPPASYTFVATMWIPTKGSIDLARFQDIFLKTASSVKYAGTVRYWVLGIIPIVQDFRGAYGMNGGILRIKLYDMRYGAHYELLFVPYIAVVDGINIYDILKDRPYFEENATRLVVWQPYTSVDEALRGLERIHIPDLVARKFPNRVEDFRVEKIGIDYVVFIYYYGTLIIPTMEIGIDATMFLNKINIQAIRTTPEIIREPPFPLLINDTEVVGKVMGFSILPSEKVSLKFSSLAGQVSVTMGIEASSIVIVPFEWKVQNIVMEASFEYKSEYDMILESIELLDLPKPLYRVLRTIEYRHFVNTTDMTAYFEFANFSGVTTYSYVTTKAVAPAIFDPSNGARLQYDPRTGIGEKYTVTVFFGRPPDAWIEWLKVDSLTFPRTVMVNVSSNVAQKVRLAVTFAGIKVYDSEITFTAGGFKIISVDVSSIASSLIHTIENATAVSFYANLTYAEVNWDRSNDFVVNATYLVPITRAMYNLTVAVRDAKDWTPVSGASVYVYFSNGTLAVSGTSDGGNFTASLISDAYYVVVNATGYESFKSDVFYLESDTVIWAVLWKSEYRNTYAPVVVFTLYKDGTPIQGVPVSLYYANGTLIGTRPTNGTGASWFTVKIGESVYANATYDTQTVVSDTYTVTSEGVEIVLVFEKYPPQFKPETGISEAKFVQPWIGTADSYISVEFTVFSTVPQTVKVNVTLYINKSGVLTEIGRENFTLVFSRAGSITKYAFFYVSLNTTEDTYLTAKAEIVEYVNDTDLDNNIAWTKEMATMRAPRNIGITIWVEPIEEYFIPETRVKVVVMITSNAKVSFPFEIYLDYFNGVNETQVRYRKKYEYVTMYAGKIFRNFTLVLPWTDEVIINGTVDVYDQWAGDNVFTYVLELQPEIKLESYEKPTILRSGSTGEVKVKIICNKDGRGTAFLYKEGTRESIGYAEFTTKVGYSEVKFTIEAPSLAWYTPVTTEDFRLEVQGPDTLYDNNYAVFSIAIYSFQWAVGIGAFILILVLLSLISAIARASIPHRPRKYLRLKHY